MYRLKIVDINNVEIFSRCFLRQKDIIQFTKGNISYNDFKPRKHPKKYRTYKNYFIIEKV
jgi:hypothetical protein